MLKPDPTRRFRKDLKKYEHNKPVKKELETVLGTLLKEEKLPEKYLDHALTGDYIGFWVGRGRRGRKCSKSEGAFRGVG